MTRAQLGRLLADNRQIITVALRDALARHAMTCMSNCEMRREYEQLLAQITPPDHQQKDRTP